MIILKTSTQIEESSEKSEAFSFPSVFEENRMLNLLAHLFPLILVDRTTSNMKNIGGENLSEWKNYLENEYETRRRNIDSLCANSNSSASCSKVFIRLNRFIRKAKRNELFKFVEISIEPKHLVGEGSLEYA